MICIREYNKNILNRVSLRDYYPFGSPMLGRTFSSNPYRYLNYKDGKIWGHNTTGNTDPNINNNNIMSYGFNIINGQRLSEARETKTATDLTIGQLFQIIHVVAAGMVNGEASDQQ